MMSRKRAGSHVARSGVSSPTLLEGHRTIRALASSTDLVIPGHDPLVLECFPAHRPDLAGWVARLDADPVSA